ncbi:MAG TPA: hypothetical protein VMV46_00005 [Thermoanaerobaculia bacterium]|nr:hypothetical protein [Thermoanaerobaculia bacterium]
MAPLASIRRFGRVASLLTGVVLLSLVVPSSSAAQEFTERFDRDRCTFATTGSNPFLPLWPGYALLLEGEEEEEGETVEVSSLITVTFDTELVDGVLTRVLEERESEDGELAEVSRNFVAYCRETGDVWYFGEDVVDFEDGEPVPADDGWRAGIDGARPGILMPGSPLVGARYFQELAPGVALDRGEVIALDQVLTVPVGTFENVLQIEDSDALDPGDADPKYYAPGVGILKDEELELVEITPPACQPDEVTLCLANGRFQVRAEWEDFQANQGVGAVTTSSDDSGGFWFFSPENTELLVKVLDACDVPGNDTFWVFAAGLTNVEVTLTVTDTETDRSRVYENELGEAFSPILDVEAFAACP